MKVLLSVNVPQKKCGHISISDYGYKKVAVLLNCGFFLRGGICYNRGR